MKLENRLVRSFAAFAAFGCLSVIARAQCVSASAGGAWQDTALTAQTGSFTVSFDATPSASPNNAVVGLSSGAQTAYAGFACLVRFNTSGDIDVRNGGSYTAAAVLPFSANATYHVVETVNVPAHTYSVTVTPPGGSAVTLATNYAFRTEQNTVASLDTWGAFVDATSGSGTLQVCNFKLGAGSGSGPFGGTAAAVPGTVEAENYDLGGQGAGYSVATVNGSANGYRSDGVDLETTSDTGGGYDVGWSAAGQWFNYTVNVASAGAYTVSFRVAAPSAVTGALHLSDTAGNNLTGAVNVPATGGWQTWTTVTASVTLPAGQQTLRLNQDAGGWNLNALSFAAKAVTCTTATVGGGWQTSSLGSSETGTFTATFDATPSASPDNAVVGFSLGSQTAYTGYACLVRFNTSRDIDARNGGSYAAASVIPYAAGSTYHFRLVVNVPSHVYSIYVTPPGGSELTVGSNYAFRTEQNTVSSLDTWGAFVDASGGLGTLQVCGFSATASSGTNYTAAQVLAGVQSHMTSSTQVNTLPHINTMTRQMNVNVYQVTTGVFAYTSSMAIDTDGSDPDPDPDHQSTTTWTDDNGQYLGAHHVPYYVLGDGCYDQTSPCPHFYYAEHNITGLQFALIFYNGNVIGAVFGDTQGDSVTPTSSNDSRELGEASVESANLLGIPSSGTTGGVSNGVTVVIFSGPSWVVHGTNTTLQANAQALVQKALNTLGAQWY